MIVFLNTMKRILKNKAQIVVMLILPLLPVIPIAMGTPSAAHTIIVGVVGEDGTILTTAFTDALKSNCKVIIVEKDKIETGLFNATMHYAIVIEKGFTENMIKSNDGMRKTSDSTVKASRNFSFLYVCIVYCFFTCQCFDGYRYKFHQQEHHTGKHLWSRYCHSDVCDGRGVGDFTSIGDYKESVKIDASYMGDGKC